MNFVCFEDGDHWHAGFLDENQLVSLARFDAASLSGVNQLIARLHVAHTDFDQLRNSDSIQVASPDARIISPVPAPGKVLCIGRNYVDHAAEMDTAVADLPVVFNKFPSCVIGTDEAVRLPETSLAVDFEAELVVVIGSKARNITEDQVADVVFGYCCGNDVTARDWQKGRPGGQWLLGKSFDTFAPVGPWIVTRDQLDASNLDIQMKLNEQVMQSDNTRSLVFSIEFLIAHLSRFFTLFPGDLLFTGTPAGVGSARNPPVFLKSGDQMEVEIAGIGRLTNPVI